MRIPKPPPINSCIGYHIARQCRHSQLLFLPLAAHRQLLPSLSPSSSSSSPSSSCHRRTITTRAQGVAGRRISRKDKKFITKMQHFETPIMETSDATSEPKVYRLVPYQLPVGKRPTEEPQSSGEEFEDLVKERKQRGDWLPDLFRTDDVGERVKKEANKIREYGYLGRVLMEPSVGKIGRDLGVWINGSRPQTTFICGRHVKDTSNTMACILENHMLSIPPVNSTYTPTNALVFTVGVPPDDRTIDFERTMRACPIANITVPRPEESPPLGEAFEHLFPSMEAKLKNLADSEPLEKEEVTGPYRIRKPSNNKDAFAYFDEQLLPPIRDVQSHVKHLKVLLSPFSYELMEPKYRLKYPHATILPLKIDMSLLDDIDVWAIVSAKWAQGQAGPWFRQRWHQKDSIVSFRRFYNYGKFDFDSMLYLADSKLEDTALSKIRRRIKILRALTKMTDENCIFTDRDLFRGQFCDDRFQKYGTKNLDAVVGENPELIDFVPPTSNPQVESGLTIVDLTCPEINDVMACTLFDCVLRAVMKKVQKFVLGLHEAQNYMGIKPRHRRFNDRVADFASEKFKTNNPTHGGNLIIASKKAFDLPRLSRCVDNRIFHRASKEHMRSFRATSDAEKRMFYGLLTPNDVQSRHEEYGSVKNQETFKLRHEKGEIHTDGLTEADIMDLRADTGRVAIVHSMSLRAKKSQQKIDKELARKERYAAEREPIPGALKSLYTSKSWREKKTRRQDESALEMKMLREADGYEWHSQSLKVLIRQRVTFDEVITPGQEEVKKLRDLVVKRKLRKKIKAERKRLEKAEEKVKRKEEHERRRQQNIEKRKRRAVRGKEEFAELDKREEKLKELREARRAEKKREVVIV